MQGPQAGAGLSLNLATVREQYNLVEAVDACVRHGIRAVDPWRDQVAKVGVADAVKAIKDNGLRVSGYCRGGMFTSPGAIDDNKRAIDEAFKNFSRQVFAEGALDVKTKQLIAVAVAHVTQCPYCIRGHTKAAVRHGATEEQIMEAIWVAAEMRAGGAFAHSLVALDVMDHAGHTP